MVQTFCSKSTESDRKQTFHFVRKEKYTLFTVLVPEEIL